MGPPDDDPAAGYVPGVDDPKSRAARHYRARGQPDTDSLRQFRLLGWPDDVAREVVDRFGGFYEAADYATTSGDLPGPNDREYRDGNHGNDLLDIEGVGPDRVRKLRNFSPLLGGWRIEKYPGLERAEKNLTDGGYELTTESGGVVEVEPTDALDNVNKKLEREGWAWTADADPADPDLPQDETHPVTKGGALDFTNRFLKWVHDGFDPRDLPETVGPFVLLAPDADDRTGIRPFSTPSDHPMIRYGHPEGYEFNISHTPNKRSRSSDDTAGGWSISRPDDADTRGGGYTDWSPATLDAALATIYDEMEDWEHADDGQGKETRQTIVEAVDEATREANQHTTQSTKTAATDGGKPTDDMADNSGPYDPTDEYDELDEPSDITGIGGGRRKTLDAIDAKDRLDDPQSFASLAEMKNALREISLAHPDGRTYMGVPDDALDAIDAAYSDLPDDAQTEYLNDRRLYVKIRAARNRFNDWMGKKRREQEIPSSMEAGPSNYPSKKARKTAKYAREGHDDLTEALGKVKSAARGAKQRALEAVGSSVAEHNAAKAQSKAEAMKDKLSPGDVVLYRSTGYGEVPWGVKRLNNKSVRLKRPHQSAGMEVPMSDGETYPEYDHTTVDYDSQFLTHVPREDIENADPDADDGPRGDYAEALAKGYEPLIRHLMGDDWVDDNLDLPDENETTDSTMSDENDTYDPTEEWSDDRGGNEGGLSEFGVDPDEGGSATEEFRRAQNDGYLRTSETGNVENEREGLGEFGARPSSTKGLEEFEEDDDGDDADTPKLSIGTNVVEFPREVGDFEFTAEGHRYIKWENPDGANAKASVEREGSKTTTRAYIADPDTPRPGGYEQIGSKYDGLETVKENIAEAMQSYNSASADTYDPAKEWNPEEAAEQAREMVQARKRPIEDADEGKVFDGVDRREVPDSGLSISDITDWPYVDREEAESDDQRETFEERMSDIYDPTDESDEPPRGIEETPQGMAAMQQEAVMGGDDTDDWAEAVEYLREHYGDDYQDRIEAAGDLRRHADEAGIDKVPQALGGEGVLQPLLRYQDVDPADAWNQIEGHTSTEESAEQIKKIVESFADAQAAGETVETLAVEVGGSEYDVPKQGNGWKWSQPSDDPTTGTGHGMTTHARWTRGDDVLAIRGRGTNHRLFYWPEGDTNRRESVGIGAVTFGEELRKAREYIVDGNVLLSSEDEDAARPAATESETYDPTDGLEADSGDESDESDEWEVGDTLTVEADGDRFTATVADRDDRGDALLDIDDPEAEGDLYPITNSEITVVDDDGDEYEAQSQAHDTGETSLYEQLREMGMPGNGAKKLSRKFDSFGEIEQKRVGEIAEYSGVGAVAMNALVPESVDNRTMKLTVEEARDRDGDEDDSPEPTAEFDEGDVVIHNDGRTGTVEEVAGAGVTVDYNQGDVLTTSPASIEVVDDGEHVDDDQGDDLPTVGLLDEEGTAKGLEGEKIDLSNLDDDLPESVNGWQAVPTNFTPTRYVGTVDGGALVLHTEPLNQTGDTVEYDVTAEAYDEDGEKIDWDTVDHNIYGVDELHDSVLDYIEATSPKEEFARLSGAEEIRFGTLDAANEWRDDNRRHLHTDDTRATKTVKLKGSVSDRVATDAGEQAEISRGDDGKTYGTAKLTDDERDRIEGAYGLTWNDYGMEAMRAKAALVEEGATDWLNYYEPGEAIEGSLANLEAGKEAQAAGQGGTGIKGSRVDSDPDPGEVGELLDQAQGESCQRARDGCEDGYEEACEQLLQDCGWSQDRIDDLLATTEELGEDPNEIYDPSSTTDSGKSFEDWARQAEPADADPDVPEMPDPITEPSDEELAKLAPTIDSEPAQAEAELTGPALRSLKKAWSGYKLARTEARDAHKRAEKYAEVINGIRAVNGQEPLDFDGLDWEGGEVLPDDPGDTFPGPEGEPETMEEAQEHGHAAGVVQTTLGKIKEAAESGTYDPTGEFVNE